ncbi:gliding motility-associated C-terminal domain-containing protein [Lutimonas saemankumensis]|uniref:T9SS type B sorting domain-containing protein n=1 Tax=Lutimonas saemankumensis TaxID=483016 RepID=UPI001CD67944|nr:gliding motility-associated C-terminal domain-containing protein [Lutimonas saemankumensis]MCA0933195.1 gliding motility-associated C-terminal domain-containing protein [Lutimonas saemankumensis]
MKRDYFNFKFGNSKNLSLKRMFLGLLFVLSVNLVFSQSTLTIVTTSDLGDPPGPVNWNMSISNPIKLMDWTAIGGGGTINLSVNNTLTPSFNFSPNIGNDPITVQTSDTPGNFNGITTLTADDGVGLQIISIDVSDLNKLERLYVDDNLLTTLDLTNNKDLLELNVSRNDLTSIDLSENKDLVELEIDANLNLTSLDISQNPKLEKLSARSNPLITNLDISNNTELVDVRLNNVPLTSASIDAILNNLDAFGKSNGFLNLQNSSGGTITKNGIAAYISLRLKNWDIIPPQGFDYGDAPDSYGTLLSSGGAIHVFDASKDKIRIGNSKDAESDGFPGVGADGDDNDNQNDEDGVDPSEFDGILTSSTSVDVDIVITSSYEDMSYLHAWIDFDGNGVFDTDEYTSLEIAANSGQNTYTLNWDLTSLGTDINEGATYARFRYTTDNDLTSSDSGGYASAGEVEDYSLVIGADTDKDGVPDSADLDADNDGILNVDEVGDTNGNGIDDMLELDSDGDGCFDVTEAGFTDGDDDGILGTSPVVVDSDGLITDDALGPIGDGFTEPNDLDNNTVYDFQEAGSAASITTEPTDQDLIIGVTTFSVVAVADTYQWQEDRQDGNGFVDVVDGGDYAGATTADLQVTNSDVSKLLYRYQVIVNNIAFACDPTTTSVDVGYITPDDFDGDGVFDIVDLDDDNDGITDADEDNGVVDRDTDTDGFPDRIDLDADGDGCFDVDENLYDNNGINQVGTQIPAAVDIDGIVTSLGPNGGYGVPVDADGNGTPDFQEAGSAASITTEPTDQDLIIGVTTFSVVAVADTYQWQEDRQDGNGFVDVVDGGDYAGATTADLQVTNSDVSKLLYRYQVIVNNIAFACDPTTTSVDVGYITPDDFDGDGVFDIVDLDDDNDGVTDADEDNGVVDRDTDTDGFPDRIDLDADGDGCFDVDENLYDNNGINQVGTQVPAAVDIDGIVTSLGPNGGYGVPVDADGNGTPDFQEAGSAASITTEPTDQDLIIGVTTFSVVAVADTYQWQEDRQDGNGFVDVVDGGDYAGATTASLQITNADFSKVRYEYQVVVSNSAFACDPTTTSVVVTFINPDDFDKDGVFDLVDEDDDNDGITDADEDNGIVDRDTDNDGFPDRIDLDADGDGCSDVDENLYDNNGINEVGIQNPPEVDPVTGIVTSLGPNGGYGTPVDADGNGTPDFQEAGAAATITTQPTDQALIIGVTTFSVVATADTYQWEESQDNGANWTPLTDGGDYAGVTTADLQVTNSDVSKLTYRYRVVVSNVAYACDAGTVSTEARYIVPSDFDNDGVFDIVDVDDDNDGILDTEEAGNTDPLTNPDALNLDADGDGCFDVTEAGFTDNGMGMLGTVNPPDVDATGRVTSATDGYTTPNDLDNNGIPDFQEAGSAAAITTQPADQNFIPGGSVTFDVTASADTYQWEESTDGTTWNDVVDGGDYSGATTASLTISNVGVGMLGYSYRVRVNNIAFACDPVTTSDSALIVSLPDNDNDLVPDIVDVDDDNDGILDTVEDNGVVDRDTDGNGIPDRFELDSDGDGCYDVTEAGFTDNGMGMLGTVIPPEVDVNGQVTSATDGYTTPNDLDNNGTPDFQEAGDVANITQDPSDQDFILSGSATFTAASDGDTYQWEISIDGAGFVPLSDDSKYSGTNTATLTVSNLVIPDYFDEYRVVVTNIAFACDPGDTSESASYNILLDSDNDGVFDIVDVDDDNDGIFDSVEGQVTDSNLDGIPDRISIDADGDGCADAIEAGFTDPDGDGRLGTSPVTVDADGKVIADANGPVNDPDDAYDTPNDLDDNGVFDFQEAGEPSSIENQPEEIEIALGDDAVFEVSAVATFYQWQQSMDGGTTWVDLANDSKYNGVDTDRLRINEARGRLEGSRYRVVLTSPDFACDPNDELISDGVRLVFNTSLIPSGFSPNGDGENDLFSIPGLIETPDFSMEVFDRWGNSVYKYMNNGSLNPDWWDGRSTGNMTLSKGQLVPAGTYFYLIKYNDGNKSPDKGWVYVNY